MHRSSRKAWRVCARLRITLGMILALVAWLGVATAGRQEGTWLRETELGPPQFASAVSIGDLLNLH